jgi:hypothetical protein
VATGRLDPVFPRSTPQGPKPGFFSFNRSQKSRASEAAPQNREHVRKAQGWRRIAARYDRFARRSHSCALKRPSLGTLMPLRRGRPHHQKAIINTKPSQANERTCAQISKHF